jgi:Transglycosylase SLT domain
MASTSTTLSQSQIQALIVSAAQQYGVDPNLALAVAKQESGFNQYAASGSVLTSSTGALGVMQLMPATAAGLGVDPTDPTQNIDGGVQLLSQLLNQFGGNQSEALAAYYAGPTAVTDAGGVPSIAQSYVTSVLGNYNAMGGGSDTYLNASALPATFGDELSNEASDAVSSAELTLGGLDIDPTVLLVGGGLLLLALFMGRE